jgi:hypothetical protein
MSLNIVDGEVYSIQYYVIKFVSNLWQVGTINAVQRFEIEKKWHDYLLGHKVSYFEENKLCHDIAEILLKLALNTNQSIVFFYGGNCLLTWSLHLTVFGNVFATYSTMSQFSVNTATCSGHRPILSLEMAIFLRSKACWTSRTTPFCTAVKTSCIFDWKKNAEEFKIQILYHVF